MINIAQAQIGQPHHLLLDESFRLVLLRRMLRISVRSSNRSPPVVSVSC
jgi:hypothetical protein